VNDTELRAVMSADRPLRDVVTDAVKLIDEARQFPLLPASARDGLALIGVILVRLVVEIETLKGGAE
jgi:hypothetical protein